MLTQFIQDESGAITVDWIMLSAAAAGMGLAIDQLVTGAVDNMVGAITHQLSDADIAAAFANSLDEFGAFEPEQLAMTDFANGAAGWSGGNVMNISGFGDLMVLGAGQSTSFSTIVPSGASSVTFTFDLIGGDSIDDETAVFSINGQTIFSAQKPYQGQMSINDSNVAGVTVEASNIAQSSHLGGNQAFKDTITRMTVTIENPSPELVLQAQSNTNQSIGDEFYGIDNFTLMAN